MDFVGINVVGVWELFVSDYVNLDQGCIVFWKFNIVVGGVDIMLDVGMLIVFSTGVVSISDNDEDGVQFYIDVMENYLITGVKVYVKLTHIYVGVLVIELKNGVVIKVLHNEEGGSDTMFDKIYDVEDFNGVNIEGCWMLIVCDFDGYDDEGFLDFWSLEFFY